MQWIGFWNEKGKLAGGLEQVARIGGLGAHGEAQLDRIAEHIAGLLELGANDDLLDVCCGNGLLTSRLAKVCRHAVGADFSPVLIAKAKEDFPSIEFKLVDAMSPDFMKDQHQRFDKISLYFSFQYFERVDQGRQVIENLVRCCKPGGLILLGDIPDREKFFSYYDSVKKLGRLILQMLRGKNDMGKFWSSEELNVICRDLGMKGEKLVEPASLPYAHYRMDYLISVPG
jgi:2-polyprenyl-3-methyl-5-hydroxy-6-metoxy-1,4-benzoquinol methylase